MTRRSLFRGHLGRELERSNYAGTNLKFDSLIFVRVFSLLTAKAWTLSFRGCVIWFTAQDGERSGGRRRFRPYCGRALSIVTAQRSQFRVPQTRSAGVTILAALEILCGIFFLLLAIFVVAIAGITRRIGFWMRFLGMFQAFISILMTLVGETMMIIGIIDFIVAYSYWNVLCYLVKAVCNGWIKDRNLLMARSLL